MGSSDGYDVVVIKDGMKTEYSIWAWRAAWIIVFFLGVFLGIGISKYIN